MDIRSRIFELVDKQYVEQQTFAAALGVSPTMVSAWRKNKSESYMKRIPQIADLLNTSVEYLMTGEDKVPADQPANGREREFLELFDRLTPEQQALVVAQLRGIVESHDK
uniref:helix-turn-helix domain-containing protein n=1 Tax=uncultured Flavonifractor sp. TaxID=1193534 RepID=UPI00261028D5|nr:helix-turn-helix domain-containing protein [uncultured Flavonifractor sp.]